MPDMTSGVPVKPVRSSRAATGSVTRADLCEAVYAEIGLSRHESSGLVEQVLDEICKTLVGGTNVKVSSFGSFILRNKGQRIGRNPKTGEEVPIEPRTVLTFRPSQLLRARINGGVDPGPDGGDDDEPIAPNGLGNGHAA